MKNKRCYTEISIDNFRKNINALMNYLPSDEKIIAVVKADYYGHGAIHLAKICEDRGINYFAVATIEEAIQLRKAEIKGNILVLGYVNSDWWKIALAENIELSVGSIEQAQEMKKFCQQNNCNLNIQIQIDTGMHRNGIEINISENDLREIYDSKYLVVKGTYSHLCTADSFLKEHIENTYLQKENFDYFLSRLKQYNLRSGMTHLCASSGIMNYPQFKYDAVRPGFMLLGFNVGEVKNIFERYPLLSWYSEVCAIRKLDRDDSISYGHIYTCPKKMTVATVSVGYGDGYPRRLSNKGYVLINGKRANILGRICMDQMMVDITDIENVSLGNKVTLIGIDGNNQITANEFANMADTIVDEIVCSINKRVERYYI